MSRPKNGCDGTYLLPPRQVKINPMKMKDMQKIVEKEQDKGAKLIHSKQYPKIWLSRVQATKVNTQFER